MVVEVFCVSLSVEHETEDSFKRPAEFVFLVNL